MLTLPQYIHKLKKLNTATVDKIKAPHKPILLLSIIQSIEFKEITENRIYITPQLVARFKDNWHHLVSNPRFTANFSLPFYHLKSERFWHLKTLPGREILVTSSASIRSFSHLKEVVEYASFDPALFILLYDRSTREEIKEALLQHYFNIHTYKSSEQLSLVAEIENQMLHEPAAVYKRQADTFDEEEIFVRGGVFKKLVPQVYNYTCCISGMRIIASSEVQMIDACHIIPFSESHDDTINNGISLCPNLHRAFDRGLITISNEYKVQVSSSFSEHTPDYSIKQFEGKPIILSDNHLYRPSLDNLSWHRRACFKT
jgi:putative restriction endonuclease